MESSYDVHDAWTTPLHTIRFHDDTILAKLFLYQDNFLCALHHEIATRIKRTFRHSSKFGLIFTGQNTLFAPQHDWEPPNIDISLDDVPPSSILNGDNDGGTIRSYPAIDIREV